MNSYQIAKNYQYPIGHVFVSKDGKQYTVTGFLGRGGQGEVYRVSGSEGDFAVKWYYTDRYLNRIDANAFFNNLSRNVSHGVPKLSTGAIADQFIWPLKIMEKNDGSFGYLMKLFPDHYQPFKNVIMMREKSPKTGLVRPLVWKSWSVRIRAALNIVRAFEILHASGYSYQDLNDGGLMVNMQTGDVLICDCDNVSPDKENLGIRGIMTYMAPEVVLNESRPDRLSDQYSLAVLLFRLFLHNHPMLGIESARLHNSEHLSQLESDMLIYGKQPHYCLSVKNNVNPPDKNRHADMYRLALTYPRVLMEAFEQVFSDGAKDPSKRLTATEWRKVLLEMQDHLLLVDGKEQFYELIFDKPLPTACRTLRYPRGRKVLCLPGKILNPYHFNEYSSDYDSICGQIIATSKAGFIGLHNKMEKPIDFSMNGNSGVCPPDGKIPLLPGMELQFGHLKVVVE